ncbi:hypothetical protein TH606_09330 [Thermodesulfatator autotrophicus]|uniref:Putative glutamate--cysteine ligase 2 n=1 Tax=Thermodesulfatator autotrophicus TaxID=1795632 RepID=A0A177E4T4_9BACT|nr:hypothetical protein TH606_09330 [Thermodesulfatator autotrophicus]
MRPEAYQSMVELVTPVCHHLNEAETFLEKGLKALEKLASQEEALIWAASLHPEAKAGEQPVWEDERYKRIFEELQLVGRRFIAQGLHIHLGMPGKEEALRVYNALRPYLPLFLALSTSSPFYEGIKTGFHSYRTKLFEVLPLAGLPRGFSSWQEFETTINLLIELKIIEGFRDLWWDIRIQPTLGTIEIRACDVPGRFKDLLAIVAFIQAMATKFLEGKNPPGLPYEAIAFGKWQAARHGLSGTMVDPQTLRRVNFATFAAELLEDLTPLANKLEIIDYLLRIESILNEKPVSFKMLALFEKGANFRQIMATMKKEFWE